MARLRKWRSAAESLQRALVLDPDLPQAWFVLGSCLLNERQTSDSRACFGRSLKLRPGYAPALLGLAAALQTEGKPDESLGIYEKLLTVQPDAEELLTNALRAAMETEDRAKARAFAA